VAASFYCISRKITVAVAGLEDWRVGKEAKSVDTKPDAGGSHL
jgi:hypothetical protein